MAETFVTPEMSSHSERCPVCGTPNSGWLGGNCPNCLMRLGTPAVGSRRSDEAELVATQVDPPPHVGGYEATQSEGPGAKPIPGAEPNFGVVRRVGDYELLKEIARGGMGAVYRARQVSLRRFVAVKILLSAEFSNETSRKRFRREAEAVASLNHPNVVSIYEVGEHEGQPYFSMELIQGRSLADVTREKPVPARQAAQWLKTIAEAVHYAHQKGVLHRDLKPSNVLLDSLDVPHVTDFGLAKLVEPGQDLTLSGQVLGTPSYMPPEQADPKRGETTAASDVYSLGAILYHLLTARPPFMAETLTQTLRLVADQEAVPPRLLNPGVPRDLETVCLKCLEKDSGRRYATAQELADELGRFLSDLPIQARPITPPERLARWCRRKPALAFSGLATVALLLTVAVGSPIAAFRINRERQAAQASAQKAVTEAAKSQQVATFIASMLEGVKPAVASGRDTGLLRDILDQTVRRLDTDFRDQPEVEAQLRVVVGRVFVDLTLTEAAQQQLRTAWAIRRRLFGDEHPDTLAAKFALAQALEVGNKWSESRMLLDEVLQQYRKRLGNSDPRTIDALQNMGNTLKRAREYPAAIAALREAVALRKSLYGESSVKVLSSLQALGCVLTSANQPDKSAKCFEEALQLGEKLSLTNDVNAAMTMGWLASARHTQGRNAEADSLFETSLELKRRLFPKDHPDIAWHLYMMVQARTEQERYGEAAPLLDKAWAIATQLPTESFFLKHSLTKQGIVLYTAWRTNQPPAALLAKEWRDRLSEIERSHPELRDER